MNASEGVIIGTTQEPGITLQERAEDYTTMDLREFVRLRQMFARGHNVNYESDMLSRFLASQDSVMSIYGTKGAGKTMFIRIEMAGHAIEYNYVSYFKQRRIPTSLSGDIVVIDDIHYMLDDINSGSQTEEQFTTFLEMVFKYAKSGRKVILISEDIFTQDYLQTPAYAAVYPELRRNSMYMPPQNVETMRVFEMEYALREFLADMAVTPRGITSFAKHVGKTWPISCEKAILMFNERVKRKIIQNEKLAHRCKKSVMNSIIETNLSRLDDAIIKRDYKSPEMRSLVRACFEDLLYKDQSYYRHLMALVKSQPND